MVVEQQGTGSALRDALLTYLQSGETDEEARARVEALPGGAEALAKAARIRAMQQRLNGHVGVTVEEWLQEKQAEREAEAERDERRSLPLQELT